MRKHVLHLKVAETDIRSVCGRSLRGHVDLYHVRIMTGLSWNKICYYCEKKVDAIEALEALRG